MAEMVHGNIFRIHILDCIIFLYHGVDGKIYFSESL